jgi:hypothetical protein
MTKRLRKRRLIADKVAAFTRHYHFTLEKILDIHGRSHFPHHGEKTEFIFMFIAKDGFATFYLPHGNDTITDTGYYLFDHPNDTLNAICQSLSLHRLQIASPNIGEPWNNFGPEYKELPPIPELNAPVLHDDVLQAAIAGKLDSLPGMTISPIVKVETGIRVAVEPTRAKVWSPTITISGIGVRRLFLWTHADIWWFPEKLNLTVAQAELAAQQDILALDILSSSSPILSPQTAAKSIPHAADLLEAQCNELLALLSESGNKEEAIHQWLNDPKHHVFLDPNQTRVESKVEFGKGKNSTSDFVVKRSDNTYLLVEIEAATTSIFRDSDGEATQSFYHAIQQVRDWQAFIKENPDYTRKILKLVDIYEPSGMVVIGRSSEIDNDLKRRRWKDLKARQDPHVYTYDELCDRVRTLAGSLRSMFQGPAH